MRTPQERGILADCLFGENYIREGALYLKREPQIPNFILADVLGELGREGANVVELYVEKIARYIGLRPLKAKDACLDLGNSLDNIGLRELNFEIPTEDRVNADLKKAGDLPMCGLTNLLYGGLTCTIQSSGGRILFTIGFPEDMASEELVISPKVSAIRGIPAQEILKAYHENLKGLCKTEQSYLAAFRTYYSRVQKQKLRRK